MSPFELLTQRFAAHEGHHVIQKPVGRTRVDQREDVRMIESRADLDLVQEPPEYRGELGAQHLHGNVAVVFEIMREIDRGHAARADLALDAIPAGHAACNRDMSSVMDASNEAELPTSERRTPGTRPTPRA